MYLETSLILKEVFQMGVQKTLYQKLFEQGVDVENYSVAFLATNRQFDRLCISLVFDKSDKQATIYNSYNDKTASISIQSIEIENVTTYDISDIKGNTEKHILYKQFVPWNCNGCSIALLTNYANNPIYQELPLEKDHFTKAGERIKYDDSDIVLKINLKVALTKNMRLRVWGYLQGEYLYLLNEPSLALKYRTYGIDKKKRHCGLIFNIKTNRYFVIK